MQDEQAGRPADKKRPGRPRAGQARPGKPDGEAGPAAGSEPTIGEVVAFPGAPLDAAGLTSRQREILGSIVSYTERHGYPPTVREVGDMVGLVSTSSVAHQLFVLEKKGYIRRDPNRPRALELLIPVTPVDAPPEDEEEARRAATPDAAFVPLLGRIAGGVPILAEEMVEDVFPLPRQLVGQGTLFLLRVVGDSMMDAAITDGDFVVVRQQQVAENGDIVAAMLDGEATVKTFRRRDGHVWLMPHNPAFQPILGDEATILGRVVTVLRRL